MTQMGLEYQKFKESQRHNIRDEDISEKEVGVKAYEASFTPRKVGATEAQAKASLQQAKASLEQAATARNRYQLDKQWRSFEESLKEREVAVKEFANDLAEMKTYLSNLPDATKQMISLMGLDLDDTINAFAAAEIGLDKGLAVLDSFTGSIGNVTGLFSSGKSGSKSSTKTNVGAGTNNKQSAAKTTQNKQKVAPKKKK